MAVGADLHALDEEPIPPGSPCWKGQRVVTPLVPARLPGSGVEKLHSAGEPPPVLAAEPLINTVSESAGHLTVGARMTAYGDRWPPKLQ
jgi:hypothetical protein